MRNLDFFNFSFCVVQIKVFLIIVGVPNGKSSVGLAHDEKLEIGGEQAADSWQGKELVFEKGFILDVVYDHYMSVHGTHYNPIFILEKLEIKYSVSKLVKLINDIPTGEIPHNQQIILSCGTYPTLIVIEFN